MSNDAESAVSAPAEAPAAAPPPAAPDAPAQKSEADLNRGFREILARRGTGRAAAPPARTTAPPNGSAAPAQAAAPVVAADTQAAEQEPKAPPEPPKPTIPKPRGSSFADYRQAAKQARDSAAAAQAEREAAAAEKAAATAERAEAARIKEAAERHRISLSTEQERQVNAAVRLFDLAEKEPELALETFAQAAGIKVEDLIKRAADRAAYGKTGDVAHQRTIALEQRVEAERAARERLERSIEEERKAREAAQKTEQAKTSEQQIERENADIVERFLSTARGLDEDAPEVLRRQAKNIPHVAAMTKLQPERVKGELKELIDGARAYKLARTGKNDLNEVDINRLSLHLESEYASLVQGLQTTLKPPDRQPLGSQSARVPGNANQEPASASTTGNGQKRVDVAAAPSGAVRRPQSEEELNRGYREIIARGLERQRAAQRR